MKRFVFLLTVVCLSSAAQAGEPRCEPAGPSYQTCKVNPDVTEKYILSAKAEGFATANGVHWMDVAIMVNGKECDRNRTKAWADGKGEIGITCELTLEKNKEHKIDGVSANGNVEASKFELTIKRSAG